jgi:hypothetical protein
MKKTLQYLCVIFVCLLPSVLCLPLSLSAGEKDIGWSYSMSNEGWETTMRSYLLMHNPPLIKSLDQANKGKKIYVKSTCGKGYATEGIYGQCTHEIDIQPGSVKFTIKGGGEVVRIYVPLVNPSEDREMMAVDDGSSILILGTVEPGCCDSPTVVSYYTETGKYIGKLTKRRASGSYGGNAITGTFRQGNVEAYNGKIYMILDREDGNKGYEAMVFKDGLSTGRIPVSLQIPDESFCEDWNIERFLYGIGKNGMGVFLTLEGQACNNDTGIFQRHFTCSIDDNAITCVSDEVK